MTPNHHAYSVQRHIRKQHREILRQHKARNQQDAMSIAVLVCLTLLLVTNAVADLLSIEAVAGLLLLTIGCLVVAIRLAPLGTERDQDGRETRT